MSPANFTVTEDAEYVSIYFSYSHSRHSVEITGTSAIPEFRPSLFPLLLIAASFVTILILVKQRRRLSGLKKGYQG